MCGERPDTERWGRPRKVKMKKILAIFVTTVAVATVAFATGTGIKKPQGSSLANGKWSIRVFYGFAGGDIKDDAEVDSFYGAGLEYSLPNVGSGATGGTFAIGAEWNTSSEGLGDFVMTNYGLYGAFYFPLGQTPGMGGLEFLGRAGYFNTNYDDGVADDNAWGFGFDAGLRYKLQKAQIELFYRMRPSVNSFSNNGIVIGVNFPIGN